MTIAKLHETEPALGEDGAICIQAWRDIGTCRSVGMTLGPPPFTAFLAWAQFHELDREAAMLVWSAICYAESERTEREASRRQLADARGGTS